jgi:hypothetical protein
VLLGCVLSGADRGVWAVCSVVACSALLWCVGVAVLCASCPLLQTVVRRLKQWQTKDPALNPFVEKTADGAVTGHSAAATTAASASPKPTVLPTDVVVPDTRRPEEDEPLPGAFLDARARVQGLSGPGLDALLAADPARTSPFVTNTMAAVRVPSALL